MANQAFVEIEKNRVERFRLEIIGMLGSGMSKIEIAKRFAVTNKALSLWLKENNLVIKSRVTNSNTKDEILPIYQIAGSLPKEFIVNKGAILIIGQPGTGKTILLNKLRNSWLKQGYKGISMDFESGGKKVAANIDGAVIESYLNKTNKISFNLFDIRAKEQEVFESRELKAFNHLQVPKYRLVILSKILKLFCLQGCDKDELVELDKREIEKLIEQVLELTYCKLSSNTPVVEDFISELRLVGETKLLANKLADKLESFVKETSSFCDWGNSDRESSDGENSDKETAYSESVYKVFQVSYLSNNAKDLIRKAKALYEVDRFLKSNVFNKKFVDVDSANQLDRDPILSHLGQIIDKTDINNGFPKTVIALVYQQYEDYLHSNLSKVIIKRRNYIFKSWGGWKHQSQVLGPSQSKIAENLIIAHKQFSQCLFTGKTDGDVLLSIEYNKAEDALLC